MTLLKRFLPLLILTALQNVTYAQEESVQYDWKEKRNKEGIMIYTSKVPGSKYKAIRGSMVVKGNIHSLIALVQDTSSCAEWADLCKESYIHKKISDTEYYVYSYNDIPFPVRDRDVLAHVTWKQNPETLTVSMTSKPLSGIVEKTKAIRIEEAISQWHFTPLEDGSTRVETYAHINPNGATPAWLTNMLLISSPFKTMSNMRKKIEEGEYKDAKISFIQLDR
ncbi:MAG: START domain-containing protein [Cellvibrionaceae bacterium]